MICEVVLIVFTLSFSHADLSAPPQEATLNSQATNSPTGAVISACPRENYNFIECKYNENAIDPHQLAMVGEDVSFDCSPFGEGFIERHKRFPKEFFVYPSSSRRCLPNGTWDGAPPLCVWAPLNTSEKEIRKVQTRIFREVPKNVFYSCSNDQDCDEARENWVSVGKLHNICHNTGENLDGTMQKVIEYFVEFPQHVHLSFMTFNLEVEHATGYNVDVRVPPQNVICEISDSSMLLLQNHASLWLRNYANLTEQCAVASIAAYSKRVVVRFMTAQDRENEPKNEWIPKPEFYAVPRFNRTSLEIMDGSEQESMFCPERPSKFPNADIVNEKSDRSSFTIVCIAGSSITDPVTNERSDRKEINCHERLEWSPYPFPVCLPQEADQPLAYNVTNMISYLLAVFVVLVIIVILVQVIKKYYPCLLVQL